ncbi:hypothetical protein FA95DRAFT_1504583 [Auriscalpium vulgare]|uniref:Uncharacterized protein n=1 Tax=Auriscalpium vulgare TaxID=40419 RepID=A0ACB8R4V4_9AGAM|nr:hypothetical protein FA95DRAFT_1504583 [Auriscalpium vulgare]
MLIRMSRAAFWHLYDLIKDDPVFHSTSQRPQRPVKFQLATFLCRMGAEGILKTSGVLAIAEGTVFLYTRRVCQAFRNIRQDHLAWPGPGRRAFLSEEMDAGWGFVGCISIGDGSYIFLATRPSVNGYAFWCRKKRYALVIQATVDHRAIFTSYDFGWPGSVQDSRVWSNSHLWRHRNEYFEPHEYVLVDKGMHDAFSAGLCAH